MIGEQIVPLVETHLPSTFDSDLDMLEKLAKIGENRANKK